MKNFENLKNYPEGDFANYILGGYNVLQYNLLAKLVQTAGKCTLLALAKQLPAGCAGVKYGVPPPPPPTYVMRSPF